MTRSAESLHCQRFPDIAFESPGRASGPPFSLVPTQFGGSIVQVLDAVDVLHPRATRRKREGLDGDDDSRDPHVARPMRLTPAVASLTVVGLMLCAGTPGVLAQESAPTDWPAVKCERYRQAWADLVARRGTSGLGPDFIEKHDAFLASGCTARADVCPRSKQELEVANVLSLRAMNAGMTGSFLPFACR